MVAPLSPPEPARVEVRPQRGPQEQFARCSADIAVYGGAAGGGKSWALLLEPLYHVANPGFGCTIFRRTYPMVTAQGGLWQESSKLYGPLGAVPTANDLRWKFPSGAEVKFAHLQHEATVLAYQGAQIPLIGFDELTHFTEYQFNYMLSRNRSTCGVRPYVRATTNPDAASWVARWIEWWIDPSTGLPIPERAGRVRWFVRDGETLRWADTAAELRKAYPQSGDPLSFTFVPASLDDNKVLLSADPRYRSALMALPRVERERLLRGNWLVSAAVGRWPAEYFGRHLWFNDWPLVEDRSMCVVSWDPNQGTGSSFGDFSAITTLLRDTQKRLYADAVGSQSWPVEEAIEHVLEQCRVWEPDALAIEGNAFQKLLKPMLLRRAQEIGVHLPEIKLIDNRVKKEIRIERLGQYLESKILRLKGGSTGARQLAEQLMVFPSGDHDDYPDSLEMAIRTMINMWNERQRIQAKRRK